MDVSVETRSNATDNDDVIDLAVSVRELVAFGESRGDINFRFSSRSSALAGIRGHQRVQKRRGDDYVAEKAVRDVIERKVLRDGWRGTIRLTVSGRVDGYYPGSKPLVVEEIKTVRGDAEAVPPGVGWLHHCQARVYACLLSRDHNVADALIRVCYLQLDDDTEVHVEQQMTVAELGAFYDDLIDRFLDWQAQLMKRRAARDKTIDALEPPYGGFRAGQREMAVTVWRMLKDSRRAVIQAPTGIGKTMASLFPAIKGLSRLGYEKVFFVTAKGSGQEAAQQAIADLRENGIAIRDVTLIAKEKACFNPGIPCHPEQCEYAGGYYDKLPRVLADEADRTSSLSPGYVATLAREEGMCPFELSLDLSRLADVVICDYNYVFDPAVYLRRYFEESASHYALLVDEAHNLVDRGRDMFSAEIEKSQLLAVARETKQVSPLVSRRLTSVNRSLLDILRPLKEPLELVRFCVVPELPGQFLRSLRAFCEAAEERLQLDANESVLALYFDAMRFLRVADMMDNDYRCVIEKHERLVRLRLLNLNPAKGLSAGFERSRASVCFSGTMGPGEYFRPLIGVGDDSDWLQVPAPFPPENLGVFVAPYVSTAWKDRAHSLPDLIETIGDVVACRSGNYLVFVPSYQYLADVADAFAARFPSLETVRQVRAMDDAAREEFVGVFRRHRSSTLVGFAVMGGVFGEGVDFSGHQLIGVIVAGVGLPGLSPERDLIAEYFDDGSGRERGFRFAYQYPGMSRVLQTAGRVIRTDSDRGIVCLVDRRFGRADYRRLMPSEWRVNETPTRRALASAVSAFWNDGADPEGRPDTHAYTPAGRQNQNDSQNDIQSGSREIDHHLMSLDSPVDHSSANRE